MPHKAQSIKYKIYESVTKNIVKVQNDSGDGFETLNRVKDNVFNVLCVDVKYYFIMD